MNRRGFTLIEITVALIIGGMAVSAAAALLTGLSSRADEIRSAAGRVDREANAERLLRDLLGNLRLSGDSTHTLSGESTSVAFLTWCVTVEGWLRPCRADLRTDSTDSGMQLELTRSAGDVQTIALSREIRGPAFVRYLRDATDGGQWVTRWSEIVSPAALEIVMGSDTLFLPVW